MRPAPLAHELAEIADRSAMARAAHHHASALLPFLASEAQWREWADESRYDVQKLAALRRVACSVRTLERIFYHKFSHPPSLKLAEWRVDAARDWIQATGASSKEVVDRFGYSDAAHLCHDFKRFLDRTPQSFSPQATEAAELQRLRAHRCGFRSLK